MLPLLQTAFEHEFTPERDFVSALLEEESEISSGLEDWMEITDGLYVERQLTNCVLQWEWLTVREQGQDAFQFAQQIRQYEQQFWEVKFDSDAVLNFLKHLPEKELSPQNYETLLAQWRADHQRRSNLWKAMKQMELS